MSAQLTRRTTCTTENFKFFSVKSVVPNLNFTLAETTWLTKISANQEQLRFITFIAKFLVSKVVKVMLLSI